MAGRSAALNEDSLLPKTRSPPLMTCMPSIISGSGSTSGTISLDELLLLLQAPHNIDVINKKSQIFMKNTLYELTFLRQNYEL